MPPPPPFIPSPSVSLGGLRRALTQWRQRHPSRSQVPEHLRVLAVELALSHGCERVAEAAQVSVSSIHRWVHRHAEGEVSPSPAVGLTLVELERRDPPVAPPATPSVSPRPPCLQLRTPEGAWLQLDLPAETAVDVLSVIERFMGSRPCSR